MVELNSSRNVFFLAIPITNSFEGFGAFLQLVLNSTRCHLPLCFYREYEIAGSYDVSR